ncbi:MAG: hypothetical protein J5871_06380 [Bacteroidales bacterium]|nr:hypothetical protein [Bacteroidales bacterium]
MQILTPEWQRELDADAVWLPGSAGAFEVLPGHAPIISTLDEGRLRWRAKGKEETLSIRCGAVRLHDGILQICVEEA